MLITGAAGLLGAALLESAPADVTLVAQVRSTPLPAPLAARATVLALELGDEAAVAVALDRHRIGAVLHTAARTVPIDCEDHPAKAEADNVAVPGLLARLCAARGLPLVHVSTDFVFNGRKDGAYTEADEPDPLSVYGASKLEGERAVVSEDPDALTVRTAWVFGEGGANFPVKILDAAKSRPELSVVTDEIGSPTYTLDLARGITALVDAGARGLFHLAGAGWCSRYELALEVLRLEALDDVPVRPVSHLAFPTRAERPLNSVLDCAKAASYGVVMPEWRDALARFLAEL